MEVELIVFFQINHKYSSLALDPKKIKGLKKFNLKTLAGFQTRNVPHRAHEYIIMDALKEVDGVFINPLIGRKKRVILHQKQSLKVLTT